MVILYCLLLFFYCGATILFAPQILVSEVYVFSRIRVIAVELS